MELKLFEFTQQVLEELDEMREELEVASKDMEMLFKQILSEKSEAYIHIKSRVKSKKSLKEKILRYDYYNKFGTKDKMFSNISDIIGIRIECRFIEDEQEIYKFIKKYFNEKSEELSGFYYHVESPNILLELASKQPKEQKNGFKLYRIDGKYMTGSRTINFEVQVKSLVNVFWSEIEHKVIYKNYNYIIADRFYKDIMKSIKNSLTTIDNQLLLISNQFDSSKSKGLVDSEQDLKRVFAKIVYDMFAKRMKESIGILVDFRESCDAIINYAFRDSLIGKSKPDSTKLVAALDRLKDIQTKEIHFDEKIEFQRALKFNSEFEMIIGTFIADTLNKEFQWNLFFRILFLIEPYEYEDDFENFISFYYKKLCDKINLLKLKSGFQEEESRKVFEELLFEYAEIFIHINDVSLLYDHSLESVVKIANSVLDSIARNGVDYAHWEEEKEIYLELFKLRVLTVFGAHIEPRKVLEFLDKVRDSGTDLDIPKGLLKYIDKF